MNKNKLSEEEEIIKCLSHERLKPYAQLISLPFEVTTLTVYHMIQMQSALFFLPLQYLEVCLRNRVNDALTGYYRRIGQKVKLPGLPEEWYMWMPETNRTKIYIKEAYVMAGKEVKDRAITSADVISHMSFGIWKHILRERPDNKDTLHFWQAVAGEIFPNTNEHKGKILQTLGNITVIRNRLFHYEPLWKAHLLSYGIEDALNELERKYDTIVDVIGWMSFTLKKQVETNSVIYKSVAETLKNTVLNLISNVQQLKM